MLRLLLALALITTTAGVAAETKTKIAKCKDAQGIWHYGDTAADECAKSNVTVINDKGIRVKDIAAPPTAAELKAREANKAAEDEKQRQVADQKKRDEQLLATYGIEDDINLARERKLSDIRAQMSSIESTLATLKATLRRMQLQADQEKKTGKVVPQTEANIAKTEEQIAKQEAAMAAREADKIAIKTRYDADLKRYREIKGIQIPAANTATPPSTAKTP